MAARATALRHFVSPRPRQGNIRILDALTDAVEESDPDVILLSISYLAPMFRTKTPVVIDFQNIEIDRYASLAALASGLHKGSAILESLKARRWEPRAARDAALCIACTPEEEARLKAWGARTCLVPHSCDPPADFAHSSLDAPVLFLGSGGYAPNDDAAMWLVTTVWPHVLRRHPKAQLRIVGRGTDRSCRSLASDSVTVVGEVESIDDELRSCALTVAPVRRGAGAQLKVVSALAHGRSMVATPYSMRSVPSECRQYVAQASSSEEFADHVVRLLTSLDDRHDAESGLTAVDWGWKAATSSLIHDLEGLCRQG